MRVMRLFLICALPCISTVAYAAGPVINNATAPTVAEGTANSFSGDLINNLRITKGRQDGGEHIGATEDEGYMRVTGGPVRSTTFGSLTSATSSTVTNVPVGPKTFVAQIINATSETKAATLTIYGNLISSTTGGIALCTITLPSTATTLQLQDSCPITEVNFPYYFYTATVYTSASSAPLTVYANY